MELIDARRALELLTDVVEGNEEYRYEYVEDLAEGGTSCVYQVNGEPSCLVGHALIRAGVPMSFLVRMDEELAAAEVMDAYLGASVTKGAVKVFDAAQVRQDGGQTWGEALEYARNTYEQLQGE